MRDIDASREACTVDEEQSRAGLGRRAFLRSAAVLAVVAALVPSGASAAPPPHAPEHARWLAQAAHVTITRDDWGVPHVVGKTDAHAVFGMIYAQAEDDFNRVERNYLVSLGRLAEAEGESAIWQDLRQRLFIDPEELKALYASSPSWLRELMDAWADGLNYYLATHPEVEPRVIRRFEPWMALSFTEGSIGGDIERISLTQLRNFYDTGAAAMAAAPELEALFPEPERETEPSGSNGIAIAPSHTRDGNALLLINPHTSHYFRHVQQVTSREGLDVYGAITWGQFFIYQGFNGNAGWMHTSAPVDNVDEFAETIVTEADGSRSYRYGDELRPVTTKPITLSYRTADGEQAQRTFTTYATHHGPIVRETGGRWVASALMNKPIEALQQSFLRTKARDYARLHQGGRPQGQQLERHALRGLEGQHRLPPAAVHADPRRSLRLSNSPSTAAIRRPTGKGCTASRACRTWSIRRTAGCTTRTTGPGRAAAGTAPTPPTIRATSTRAARTSAGRMRSGSCPRGTTSPWRRSATPPSIPTSARSPSSCRSSSRRGRACPTATSRRRGSRSRSSCSVTGTTAGAWIRSRRRWPCSGALGPRNTDAQRLASLDAAVRPADAGLRQLEGALGRDQPLPAQRRRDRPDVRRREAERPGAVHVRDLGLARLVPGVAPAGDGALLRHSGNSFVSVVEFGPRLRAWAVREGGNSGDPDSPHFFDQAERYANGDLRPVYFHPKDLKGHIERTYKPGK